MSDALVVNSKGQQKRIWAKCLAHARRKFYDIAEIFPDPCRIVLDAIGKNYKFEAETRGLSGEDRLRYHQTHSGPVMRELKEWIEAQLNNKEILNYKLDIGALGYSKGETALLSISDLTKDLTQFNLPDNIEQAKWIDNETISARIDVIPYIRNGEKPPIRDIEVNGVKVKVAPHDHIEKEFHIETEHREASPDGKYELLRFR